VVHGPVGQLFYKKALLNRRQGINGAGEYHGNIHGIKKNCLYQIDHGNGGNVDQTKYGNI
jgi:hypothetical protein